MIFEKELLDEFVADSKEHLDSIEDDFLTLEKQKDNPDKKIVDKVFRAIHSIKGAAGFFGLSKISDLSHLMETLLSMIRTGDIRPESHFIDGLLSGTDHLNAMLDNVEYSNDTDITKILQSLSDLLENKISSQVREELNTSVCLSDECGDDIGFDINAFTLKNFSSDTSLYVLQYDLAELDRLEKKRPVMLIRELQSSGEIIDAQIHTALDDLHGELADTSLFYNVLYAADLSSEQICRVTGLPEDRVITVQNRLKKDQQKIRVSDLPCDDDLKEDLTASKDIIESKTDLEHISHLRIHTDILDRLMALTGELVLVRNRKNLVTNQKNPVSRSITQALNLITGKLQETVMGTRMQALGVIFNKFPKLTNQLEQKLGKKIKINISGSDVELDKTVLESLADPMVHLIRNCCDHGIETPGQRKEAGKPETGNIFICAWHEAGRINIEIKDDGKGIDPGKICEKALEKGFIQKSDLAQMSQKEILYLIFIPGFSTANKISEVSGRGVGMDVVKTGIEKTGGTIRLESNLGKGTEILITLPLTLAIIPCLIVKSLKNYYAVPQINVEELLCLYEKDILKKIEYTQDQEIFRLRNTLLPIVRLSEVLERPIAFTRKTRAEISETYKKDKFFQSINIAVLSAGSRRFGLVYDEILGFEEIVVKPLHPNLKSLEIYSGVTIMGDGRVALILNPQGIAVHAGTKNFSSPAGIIEQTDKKETSRIQDILIFKSGSKERFALELKQIKRMEKIRLSDIERIKNREFISINGKSVFIMRLDKVLNVSPCTEKAEMFLIIPKDLKQSAGILISEFIDVVQFKEKMNIETYMEDGLKGTGIILDHMTLFLDIYRLFEKAGGRG